MAQFGIAMYRMLAIAVLSSIFGGLLMCTDGNETNLITRFDYESPTSNIDTETCMQGNCSSKVQLDFIDGDFYRKELRGFWGFVGKGLGIAADVIGIAQKTRTDHKASQQLETNFQNVFGSLDRNLQAITNTQEAIDLMMTKSLDAIAGLDQKLGQSTAQMLDDLGKIDQKVDRNFGYLLKVFKIATETYAAVENSRYEMHEEFKQVLELVKNSTIEPTVTKLNNFVSYFSSETMRISTLSRDERITTFLEETGFIRYLRESRTPKGDSLQTAIFEITNQGFAIPQNVNDTQAYAALSSLYYGAKTQISVMRYLTTVNIYLADNSYRIRDLDNFNHHMERMVTDFGAFSDSLVGRTYKTGLIDETIGLLKRVANMGFAGAGEKSSLSLIDRAESLELDKTKLQETFLPIIQDVPGKLMGQLKFGEGSLPTSVGRWKNGAQVSYALQYTDRNNMYSKVGEWSEPFFIDGRANPRLRIPAHSTFTRLIFRRFNNEMPQFVGRLECGSHIDFWDIDRDLYDAAAGPDETKAKAEAALLIANGANVRTVFDLGKRALHAAAMNGNVELARALLLNHSDSVTIQDSNGYTPLHVAAEHGWTDFINLMLQYNAEVNARTKSGSTPLHLAVSNGFPSAVQALLNVDIVDVNAQDVDGAGPLHKAVINGDEEVLQYLLTDKRTKVNLRANGNITSLHLSSAVNTPRIFEELTRTNGAWINAQAEGNISALHIAIISGNIPALQTLLGLEGTDVNVKSVNGWAPLHYAVSLKNDIAVSELLKVENLNVDVLATGLITPLHVAAAADQISMLKNLLEHGAALDMPSQEGLTALHIAAINRNLNVVKLLVENNANLNARTSNGSSILHLTAVCSNLPIVKYILETGKPIINARNDFYETPLELAARGGFTEVASLLKSAIHDLESRLIDAAVRGDLDAVKLFLAKGANVEARNSEETSLNVAAWKGHLNIVMYLVEKGAYINNRKSVDGSTPLHTAAAEGHLDVVEYLVDNGADIRSRNSADFETPLDYACMNGRLDVVQYLVTKGSDINARCCDGGTPLTIAVWKGYLDVTKFLVEHGADINARKVDGSTPLSIAIGSHADVADYLRSKGAVQ